MSWGKGRFVNVAAIPNPKDLVFKHAMAHWVKVDPRPSKGGLVMDLDLSPLYPADLVKLVQPFLVRILHLKNQEVCKDPARPTKQRPSATDPCLPWNGFPSRRIQPGATLQIVPQTRLTLQLGPHM